MRNILAIFCLCSLTLLARQSPANDPPAACVSAAPAPKGTATLGATKGLPTLPVVHKDDKPASWSDGLDLPKSEVPNFEGEIKPENFPPGKRVYRIIGQGGNPRGGYWTDARPPKEEARWRSKFAVLAEWNGGSCVEEYRVADSGLKVWRGKAAPQLDGVPDEYLKGGGMQLFIPSAGTQIDLVLIHYHHTPWAARQ